MAKKRKTPRVDKSKLRAKYTGYADPYRESYTTDQLLALRRKYAKAANQRIRRMSDAGYKISDSPALELLSKQNKTRFSEVRGVPKHLLRENAKKQMVIDKNALKREVSTLSGFLGSVRTTVEGTNEIITKTGETFAKKFGIELQRGELKYLLENFNDFKSAIKFNSDAILQAIGEVSGDITNKQQIKQIVKELKQAKTTQEAARAVYEGAYKRRKKNRPEAGAKIAAIEKAIIK